MENLKAYTGEDLALCGKVTFSEEDTSQTLGDFDIVAEILTTALGRKVLCSTIPGRGLEVMRRPDNGFAVNIPNNITRTMAAGEMLLSLALIHKETGVRLIAEHTILTLAESKISKQL